MVRIIYLPKKAPYLNPNERKVNQRIKSNICVNRFYDHIVLFPEIDFSEANHLSKVYLPIDASTEVLSRSRCNHSVTSSRDVSKNRNPRSPHSLVHQNISCIFSKNVSDRSHHVSLQSCQMTYSYL